MQDVQDQSTQEELTDEQADAKFEADLRGGEPESPAPEPEGETKGDEGTEETVEATEPDYKSEADALKKELARVREGKREEKDQVDRLKAELDEVKKQVQPKKNPVDEWTIEYTQSQLDGWEDKIDELRDAGDTENLKIAKQNYRFIRSELDKKKEAKAKETEKAGTVEQELQDSTLSMNTLAIEKFPDIENKESDLYHAVNEEYGTKEFRALNESLGTTLASHFALYRLILKNPDILKGKVKPEKVLKDVNKTLTKASMNAGSKNDTAPPVNIGNLSDQEQDKIMDELLRGARTSV